MLEAKKITHNLSGSYVVHIILFAICIFGPAVFANPSIADDSQREINASFQRKLLHLNRTVLGNYSSPFDTVWEQSASKALIDPVPVSLPSMVTLVNSSITIPVTVGDTTGEGIRSIQFDLLYDEDVIVPQASPIDTVGTISDGMGVSVNNTVPGILRVVFFSSTHRAGSGTLFNFRFTAVGTDGQVSPLTWQNFMFNEGDPAANVTNGSITLVTNHTITVTQTANGTIAPGTTVVPYGANQSFTITPAANHHIVSVLVDGLSVGAVSNYTFNNVTANHTIAATFRIKRFALTVTKAGNGQGTVTSAPAGIECGNDCTETYDVNTVVTLTASPPVGVNFAGWSGGGCAGTGTCVVTVTAATSVTATFERQTFELRVERIGTGTGTVTSSPPGIDCGSDCFDIYEHNTVVTLTATPNVNSTFAGWSGGCSGTGTCVVTMSQARNVMASFAIKTFKLEVLKAGSGGGTVTSAPIGIDCGTDCEETYNYGTVVTLTAAPNAASNFTGWSGGGCSGTGTCVVTMTQAAAVTATFVLKTFELTVSKAGTGTGSVTSSPSGINCGADCSEVYTINTPVTLTATADAGSTFDGWTGAGCSGTGTCVVTITAATGVTANFTRIVRDLNIIKSGNGFGTISSAPAGINCTANCSAPFPLGTQVTLSAAPNFGSNFVGWSGSGCSGTGTCVVTMDAAKTVTANFVLQQFQLSVVKAGTGAANGTVLSSPAGITCGSDCDEPFNFGNAVSLTASATPGTTFNGWTGGGCSGTGSCVVTVLAASSVTATFTIQTFGLTVTKGGNGSGVVTSDPAGINCGSDCAEVQNIGSVVTLTAAPATGSNFVGWTGACSGTGACTVTMNQATMVNAVFTLQTFTFEVSKNGNGTGTVTSSPGGINCGPDCSESYNYGLTVTLSASPTANSDFGGWTGAGCSGTGTCVVPITQAESVIATFTLKSFTLNVNKVSNGTGTVTSSPPGIDCGGDCTEVYNIGTVVTLTATPGSGSSFAGWSGACSGTGTCVLTMTAAASVTASFNTFPLVQFSSATFVGNESRTAMITVARSGDLNVTSSVTLSTSPGTAVGAAACAAGIDYVDISHSVNFALSEASKTVPITLCPDTDIDPSETISILLSSPVTANTGSQSTSIVTINDTANQHQASSDGILMFSATNSEPNPSVINAINAPTGSARIRVTLYDVWHANPGNLYALLVSPFGSRFVLMGAVGGSSPISPNGPVTLTFGNSTGPAIPASGPLVTGAYKPTTCSGPIADFPSPAPEGPYFEPGCDSTDGPTLSGAFILQDLNGPWSLYLMDSGTGVPFTLAGAVTTGWGLELLPTNEPPVTVGGQVFTPNMLGLRNAIVTLTDPIGNQKTVPTSSLGFFSFDDVQKGGPYTLNVMSRRYRFERKVLQIADNIQGLEVIGLE